MHTASSPQHSRYLSILFHCRWFFCMFFSSYANILAFIPFIQKYPRFLVFSFNAIHFFTVMPSMCDVYTVICSVSILANDAISCSQLIACIEFYHFCFFFVFFLRRHGVVFIDSFSQSRNTGKISGKREGGRGVYYC